MMSFGVLMPPYGTWARGCAMALCVLAAMGADIRADSAVLFPPFVVAGDNNTAVQVPKCTLSGDRMQCEFLTVSVFPWGDKTGQCYLNLSSEQVSFRRDDAGGWEAETTVAFCRTKTLYRLSQGAGAPRRIVLQMTFELGDRSERCVKSFAEFQRTLKAGAYELAWTEGPTSTPLPVPMPDCRSFVTGPGKFPAEAFAR